MFENKNLWKWECEKIWGITAKVFDFLMFWWIPFTKFESKTGYFWRLSEFTNSLFCAQILSYFQF